MPKIYRTTACTFEDIRKMKESGLLSVSQKVWIYRFYVLAAKNMVLTENQVNILSDMFNQISPEFSFIDTLIFDDEG